MASTIAVEESALTSLKTAYTTLAADVKSASGYVSANCELTNASGVLLAPLEPAYNACRDIASDAITALGTALGGLATHVEGVLSDAEKTEQANQSVTSKLNALIAEVAQLKAEIGAGGAGGGGGYSGGGGDDAGSAPIAAGAPPASSGTSSAAGGAAGGGVPTSSLAGSADGSVPTPSTGTGTASTGTSPAGATPISPTTGTPVTGDTSGTDFTVNVQDHGQNDTVTVNNDGSVSVTVDPTSTAAAGAGAAQASVSAQTTSPDVTATVANGASPDFSVSGNGDGGVSVVGVTLGGGASASTDASSYQPTDTQYASLAASDPLGRTANELQSAWQGQETLNFSASAAGGLLTDSAGGTTLDLTALMGLVQQAETSGAQGGGITWAQ